MGEFALKANGGEVIKKINARDLDDAIEYFAKLKNLKKKQLLNIFSVERVS